MTQECTYNIPIALLDAYKNRPLILRATNPVALAESLSSERCGEVVLVQLLGISTDLEALSGCGYGVPIEIVLNDPLIEAARLYRVTKLRRTHPVRIVIPVVAGFSKAVKVASSLHLPVKLEGTQPGSDLIEELCSTLDFFLHNKAVSQPIDYFSGLLMAILHNLPITLWDIQEEDPSLVRYIADDGQEVVARGPFVAGTEDLDSFRIAFTERVLSANEECASCQFFQNCGGYFKWPDQSFSCDGIKRVFHQLRDAARELDNDLASYSSVAMEPTT